MRSMGKKSAAARSIFARRIVIPTSNAFVMHGASEKGPYRTCDLSFLVSEGKTWQVS